MVELLYSLKRLLVYRGDIIYPSQNPNHQIGWIKIRCYENIKSDIDKDIQLDKYNSLLPTKDCECSKFRG